MIKDDKHSENQLNKDEAEFVSSLNESFEKLEQSFSFTIPELSWFEQKMAQQKKQMRKKWYQDLLLFSGVAIIILSFMFMTLFQNPYVFFSLQIVSVIFLIGYTTYECNRRREMGSRE